MSDFQPYRRKQIAELRPCEPGEDLSGVSISAPDREAGSPKAGDMIARNPKNHADQWLVAAQYFADNFEPVGSVTAREPAEGDALGWCILELMGHRRLAGRLEEVTGGALAGLLRIEIPGAGDAWTTQYYSEQAVYCITPTTEEVARAVALRSAPAPVHRWELPAPQAGPPEPEEPYDPGDDHDDDIPI